MGSLRVNLLLSLESSLLVMLLIHMDMVFGAEKNVRLKLSPKLMLMLMLGTMATMDILDTMVVDTPMAWIPWILWTCLWIWILWQKISKQYPNANIWKILSNPGTESTFHPRGGSTFQIAILKREK